MHLLPGMTEKHVPLRTEVRQIMRQSLLKPGDTVIITTPSCNNIRRLSQCAHQAAKCEKMSVYTSTVTGRLEVHRVL